MAKTILQTAVEYPNIFQQIFWIQIQRLIWPSAPAEGFTSICNIGRLWRTSPK